MPTEVRNILTEVRYILTEYRYYLQRSNTLTEVR